MSPPHHVIVDGSNLATEGRMVPSLAQLDACVQAYRDEDPDASIVVVVDATFGHRIDQSERATYDEAIDHGELLTPPAGAVGRGDGFILKIADKADAVVLSNDSFQEFHGEYPWLFDAGRLIGGKPVPTIGWVFTPRSPVRGPKSRAATSKASGAQKAAARSLPAKKLTVTLPDGAKPSIGDVITPPQLVGDLVEPEQPLPRKRATRKRTAEVPETEPSQVADELPIQAKKVRRGAKSELGAEGVAAEATAELPAPTRPKKTRTRKIAEVSDDVAGHVSGGRGDEQASSNENPSPKSPGRRRKAAKPDVEPPVPTPVKATSKKRASAKADGDGANERSKSTVKTTAPGAQAPVNEALAFLTFVSAHPVAALVEGTVSRFTSHGAMVTVIVDGQTPVLCYAPTKLLGTPPPKSAREVLTTGESYTFTVVSLDVKRRVAEVTLAN